MISRIPPRISAPSPRITAGRREIARASQCSREQEKEKRGGTRTQDDEKQPHPVPSRLIAFSSSNERRGGHITQIPGNAKGGYPSKCRGSIERAAILCSRPRSICWCNEDLRRSVLMRAAVGIRSRPGVQQALEGRLEKHTGSIATREDDASRK